MSDADRFERFYDSFRPTIDRMSDAFLVETIRDGKAKGVNPLIMAALIAEATFRGIRLDDKQATSATVAECPRCGYEVPPGHACRITGRIGRWDDE